MALADDMVFEMIVIVVTCDLFSYETWEMVEWIKEYKKDMKEMPDIKDLCEERDIPPARAEFIFALYGNLHVEQTRSLRKLFEGCEVERVPLFHMYF